MNDRTMRNPYRRRRLLGIAIASAAATVATLLPGQTATADALLPGVLSATIRFPGGLPAPGAEVRLIAQPDPVWPETVPTGAAGDVGVPPEQFVASAVADQFGRVSFDVPETPALVDLARHQGGRVKTVLSATAQQGTADAPVYFKRVTTVLLTLDQSSSGFDVPDVHVDFLLPLDEFGTTILEQLGEQTLAMVGTLLDMTDPHVAQAAAALDKEMTERGYLFDNEAVAYNVHMLDGTYTWITHSPDDILVWESPDADVYSVLPLSSGGFPVLDTTDAGDGIDDVAGDATGSDTAKKERGKWAPHHGDCYWVEGPLQASTKRYQRRVCYNVDHQQMDTVKGTSYWQYQQDAQGQALPGNTMKRIWVHGQPYGHGTATMNSDGLPIPVATQKQDGSCTTTTDEIYAESGAPTKAGIKRSWAHTRCKQSWYGPVLFPEDGNHAAEWETEEPVEDGVVRATALQIPVHSRTKDGSPIWNVLSGQWVNH